MTDLSKTLYRLMNSFREGYRGMPILRDKGKFIVHGHVFSTLDEAKNHIDDLIKTWNERIKQQNPQL